MKTHFLPVVLLTVLLPVCCNETGTDYGCLNVKDLQITPVQAQNIVYNDDGSIFLDFGKDAFGRLQLALDADEDSEISVLLGEKSVGGTHVDTQPGGHIRFAAYSMPVKAGYGTYNVELRPDKRNTRAHPVDSAAQPILLPDSIGVVFPFRYCEITGLKGGVDAENTKQLSVHYPFDESASMFHSSDSVLNAVWDLCKYSIKATSFCGYYVDGDRERIPYEADALLNQLSHYCVDREYGMARQTMEYLMQNPTWPTEWQLSMVFMFWYDYLYTGDKELLVKYYDEIKAKTLFALRDTNALISTRTGKLTSEVLESIHYFRPQPMNDIVDWPRPGASCLSDGEIGEADGYELTDYNTAVNAMHYGALTTMEKIADALGNRDDAEFFRSEAALHLEAFNTLLLCPDGIYKDGVDTGHRSLHANMFPLLYGMVPERYRESVKAFVKSRGMACSVYGAQFLLDALYDAGESEYALSLMTSLSDRSWYNMIRSGSTITMEAWDMKYKSNLDWNHAWGAAPANIIPRWIAGVQPLEPGCRKMLIHPHPQGLEHFEALVPTLYGGISVSVDNRPDSLQAVVSIPRGVRAKLMLPFVNGESELRINGSRRKCRIEDGCFVTELGHGKWHCTVN